MMAREVAVDEFVRGLGPQQQLEVQANLDSGRGMALYYDGRSSRLAVSFGTRDADIVGMPPKAYGGGELDVFVSPRPAPANMVSPLLSYQPPPQVARPRVAPTSTAYPEVLMSSARTSPHPRGDSEYITPQVPGREPGPVATSRTSFTGAAMVGRASEWPRRSAMKTRDRHESREVGIPGDKYRVELRGASYWVINADTGAIMGGPWQLRAGSAKPREKAQERADMLNRTFWRRHG